MIIKGVLKNEKVIQEASNLKKAYKDYYIIVVKDSDDTYRENIVVN